jgi:hypothetical protein
MKRSSSRFRWRWVVPLCVVAAAGATSPLTAFGADSGTVGAQVVAGVSPCITISSPANQPVDFGSLAFSTSPGSSQGPGAPNISVASCANASQLVYASGTNAMSPTNAIWTLVSALPNSCTNAPNQYRLALRDANLNTDFYLTTTNQQLTPSTAPLAGNATLTRTPRIVMPCTGSAGAGLTMSMSFNFTATLA